MTWSAWSFMWRLMAGRCSGRHREGDEHRLDLRDGHQLGLIRRHQVAGLDRQVAGAAVDRRRG